MLAPGDGMGNVPLVTRRVEPLFEEHGRAFWRSPQRLKPRSILPYLWHD
jgi:hypothetical protein